MMGSEMQRLLDKCARLAAENARLRGLFTNLDQPKYKGAAMLDEVLKRPSPEFRAWVESLPAAYWARYDLSAARIGWEAGRAAVNAGGAGSTTPEGRDDAGQMLADDFNRRYLKATQTSEPEDYFEAALLGRRLVNTLAEHGVITDLLPELQRESPNAKPSAASTEHEA